MGSGAHNTADREPFRAVLLRQGYHGLNALWGVLAYHYVVPRWLAAGAIGFITLIVGVIEALRLTRERFGEEIRRHPLFGRMIRPHEDERVSGAFWFVLGVFLSLVFFPKEAVEAGCLVMGFGDSASTLVGRRWGTRRLIAHRSLEGTFAFILAAALSVFLFRLLVYPAGGVGNAALWGLVGGVFGALVELFSVRVDDNLTVPVLTSAIFTILF